MEDISVEELRERLAGDEAPALIDVRETYEHDEFNIGGRNLPLGEIQRWIEEVRDLNASEVVLYCRTGNRSGMAAAFMKAAGYSKARNLTGGVVAWQQMETDSAP